MRPKELRIVVTFETTTASGCGLSFSAPIEEKEQIYNLIQQLQYQQVLELII